MEHWWLVGRILMARNELLGASPFFVFVSTRGWKLYMRQFVVDNLLFITSGCVGYCRNWSSLTNGGVVYSFKVLVLVAWEVRLIALLAEVTPHLGHP